MKSAASQPFIRSQPAVKHKGSPTIGSHDNSNSGLPHFFSCAIARCWRAWRG